ncbi:MAG: hypothetical protein K0S65_5087 [Labilithrix sp.]|nr:hypothetical protein [Labilithrix sp.]
MSGGLLRTASFSCAVLVAVACAATGSETLPREEDKDSGPAVVPEPDSGMTVEVDSGPDGNAPELPCSPAGWCVTATADPATNFYEVAPVTGAAYALAWVRGRTTFMVFDGAQWNAVPHEHWDGVPKGQKILEALWAQKRSEVFVGGAEGFVARGTEQNGTWTWEREPFPTIDTVRSVWGDADGTMYATTENVLYRRSGAAGSTWTVEFDPRTEADATPELAGLKLAAVFGTSSDDLWLTGAAVPCMVIFHKSAEGWATLAQGTPTIGDPEYCSFSIPPDPVDPWSFDHRPHIVHPHSVGRDAFIAVAQTKSYGSDAFPIRAVIEPPGTLRMKVLTYERGMQSAWTSTGSRSYIAGFGRVLVNPDPLDGGSWEISSIALNGKATLKQFEVIRGTSESDLWLVGDSYALHKTTP